MHGPLRHLTWLEKVCTVSKMWLTEVWREIQGVLKKHRLKKKQTKMGKCLNNANLFGILAGLNFTKNSWRLTSSNRITSGCLFILIYTYITPVFMLIVIAVQPLNNEIIQLSSNSLVFLPNITSTKSASPAFTFYLIYIQIAVLIIT